MKPRLKNITAMLYASTKFVVHDDDTGLHTDELSTAESEETNYQYQIQTVSEKFLRGIYVKDGVLHICVTKENEK